MSVIRARMAAIGAGPRAAIAVVLILSAGGVASVITATPADEGQRPRGLAGLVDAGDGRIVVDREGDPVRGPDGKPLRVAADGKTLLDSQGRPLRDAAGRPLRLGPGNKLPREAERRAGRRADGKRPRRRRPSRPRRPRPAPTAAPAGPPIVIGVAHLKADSHNTFMRGFGSTTTIPDPAIAIRALGAWLNATGGILGRPVKLDVYEYDPTPFGPGTKAALQATCEHFRETRPLAVVERFGSPADLLPCLAEADIPMVADWPVVAPTPYFHRYPSHYYAPGALAADRAAEPYVQGLLKAGFFGRGERVGLLRSDNPVLLQAGEEVKRELREAGVELALDKVIGVTPERQTAAAFEFKAKGITRVLSATEHTFGFFLRTAYVQRYFPRYGLSSMQSPNWLAIELGDEGGDAIFGAEGGAVGVGWAPLVDVPEDGEPPNGTRALCAEAFRAAGADIGNRTTYAQYAAYGYCDGLLAIRAALERSRRVSVAGLREGIDSLGTSYESPVTLRTRLDSARHDGAAGVRLFSYRTACGCFRYGE